MWHLGIDLHRRTVVVAAVRDSGETIEPRTFGCRDVAGLLEHVRGLQPFRAVVEATSTYRWLYDLLSPEGPVLLAHPAKLRLMIQRRDLHHSSVRYWFELAPVMLILTGVGLAVVRASYIAALGPDPDPHGAYLGTDGREEMAVQ